MKRNVNAFCYVLWNDEDEREKWNRHRKLRNTDFKDENPEKNEITLISGFNGLSIPWYPFTFSLSRAIY